MTWTIKKDESLAKMWADGKPTKTIAAEIGKTKNAVIARAKRLNLPPHKRKPNNKIIVNVGRGKVKKTKAKAAPRKENVFTALGKPKNIEEIRGRDCRFPIGDPRMPNFHFCGAPVEKFPYCPEHRAITHRKAPADE